MQNSWCRILASYSDEKRTWDARYPNLRWIMRPLSFPLTWIALIFRLTPNMVTLLSVIALIQGCILLCSENLSTRVAGVALVILFNLLDCVDGNLARLKTGGKSNPSGAFIDGVATYPCFLVFLCLGVGVGRDPSIHDTVLAGIFGASSCEIALPFFILIGAFGSISRLMEGHIGMAYLKWKETVLGPEEKGPGPATPSAGPSFPRLVWLNLNDIQGHDVLLPFLLIYGFGGWYLLWMAFGGAASFLLRFFYYCRRVLNEKTDGV